MLNDALHQSLQDVDRELRAIVHARPRYERPPVRSASWRDRARRVVATRPRAASRSAGVVPEVRIREAAPADARALARLAELSERRLPSGPVLVAEVESRLVAALPLERGEGHLIADLWRPTGDVIQLLELRLGQLRAAGEERAALQEA